MRASDHAVLRFMERELGVDVEAVRAHIEGLFQRSEMQAVTSWADGARFRVIRNGIVFCCRDNTVTTCYRQGPGSFEHPAPRSSREPNDSM